MIEKWINQLRSNDFEIASEAAGELAKADAKAAVPELLARLKKVPFKKSGDAYLAASVIGALGRLSAPGNADVIGEILNVLKAERWSKLRDDSQIEETGIEALRALKAAEAVDWLALRFVDREWPFAEEIATCLCEIAGVVGSAPLFKAAATNAELDTEVRAAACAALGKLRHLEATSLLESLNEDSDAEVAEAAQVALLDMYPERARAAVEKAISLLDGTTPVSRWEAVASLILRFQLVEAVSTLLDRLDAILATNPTQGDWFEKAVWRVASAVNPAVTNAVLLKAWSDPQRTSWTRLSAGTLLLASRPEFAGELLDVARLADAERQTGGPAWNYVLDVLREDFSTVLTKTITTDLRNGLAIVKKLDELRRGPASLPETSLLRQTAAKIISQVTGTDRYSVFDTWLEQQTREP